MASSLHNLSDYDPSSVPSAEDMRFGIVVSEWNNNITGALLQGAYDTLLRHGALEENICVMTVPGSFELVYGSSQMVKSGKVDAVIAIGCVIRGDTPHFDHEWFGHIESSGGHTSHLRSPHLQQSRSGRSPLWRHFRQ